MTLTIEGIVSMDHELYVIVGKYPSAVNKLTLLKSIRLTAQNQLSS